MKKIFLIICFSLFMSSATYAEAATLYFSSEKNIVDVQEEFYVDVLVDTDEDYINAAQSVVSFSPRLLEVVNISRANSVFKFWVEEPVFSNEEGAISFIGGTTRGLIGGELHIVRINFRALNSGLVEITFAKPIVTANDGKGTNVLNTVKNTSITIRAEAVVGEDGEIVSEPQIEQPEIIIREAAPAKDLPAKPELRVPLYASQEDWYTYQGETIVFWEVPDDVVKIAVDVNSNPKAEPQESEDELFTGKNLGILDEGVHYIHVQFKNNIGWGSVAHYKIAIDVTSPLAFEVKTQALFSDSPTPEMTWLGVDSLSGYSHSVISLDGQEPFTVEDTTIVLEPQKPGKHTIRVDVFDKAGNCIDNELSFEILPLETPAIDFVTSKLSLGDTFYASGRGIYGEFVDYIILEKGVEAYSGVAEVDNSGKWEVVIKDGLDKGGYTLTFMSRNSRGATSYPTEEIIVKVGARNVLSVAFIDLSWPEILTVLGFIIVIVGGSGSWYYIEEKKKKYAYRMILNRDIQKVINLLDKNLGELESLLSTQKRIPKEFQLKSKSLHGSMRKTITNIKKYINIDKYIK